MHTYFYKDRDGRPAFPVDSFFDVLSGKIPAEKYRDKIVLIGATAAGVGAMFVTPVSPSMPPVTIQAHTVSSISRGILRRARVGKLGFAGGLPPGRSVSDCGAAAAQGRHGRRRHAAMVVALLGAHFVLMARTVVWIQLMSAAVLLVLGHLALTTKRFLVTEGARRGRTSSRPRPTA